MPNRKIEHIIAKAVGSETEETLDVYDAEAVHVDDVVNNLTSTSDVNPLSANMGKTLNDSIAEINNSLALTPLHNIVSMSSGNITLTNGNITDYNNMAVLFGTPRSSPGFCWGFAYGWNRMNFSASNPYVSVSLPDGKAVFRIVDATTIAVVSTDMIVRRIFGIGNGA